MSKELQNKMGKLVEIDIFIATENRDDINIPVYLGSPALGSANRSPISLKGVKKKSKY
jgi:hypothetical protein